MTRTVGTVVRGIRTPIIKEDTNLADVVVNSIMEAQKEEGFTFHDRDIIAITEAVVGISEGNFIKVDDIAYDIKNKYPDGEVGIVYPILSRNRFSLILKGIARGCKKIYMLLSFPKDEVGNSILDLDTLENSEFDLGSIISESEYDRVFSSFKHPFTGINMVEFYREVIHNEGCEVEFIFSNQAKDILKYTSNVLTCDIHNRVKTKENIISSGGTNVYGLYEIMTKPINGSGYNPKYGLLGSNKSTEEKLKLFPKTGDKLVIDIQNRMYELTGKKIEVMVYGDGAFKDPVGKIWELADPVVSPFYTKGLEGTPNELKLKYLADNKYSSLNGEELNNALTEEIKNKNKNLVGENVSLGTTPRRYTDLLGSLADLTSGSGDKGTPVVLIQHYFDNYSD